MEDSDVRALSQQLLARSFPRLQMLLLLALAGLGAFLASAVMLRVGLVSMPARYFIAAALGYLLFLALVRGWLAYQRHRWLSDFVDLPFDLPVGRGFGSAPPFSGGGGGHFSGGGASGSFAPTGSSAPSVSSSYAPDPASEGASILLDSVPDADEAWPLALIALGLLMLAAGMTGAVFVIWASPALFAEVLLDAAVVGAVYRRARRRPRTHWLQGVFRRTWMPAATLCVVLAIAGFALQITNPGAHSLGAVVRAHDSSP